jgi:hypothetical protein
VFGLSLVDHLRLTFGHVIFSHRAHAEASQHAVRWDRWLRLAEAALVLATAIACVSLAFNLSPPLAIVAATCATCALLVLGLRLTLGLERTASIHRDCSTRLWYLREQYRALLADLNDGVLTAESARERRDALMASLHQIYQDAPAADRQAYQTARQTLGVADDAALSEEEIDRFLPVSLQKVTGS